MSWGPEQGYGTHQERKERSKGLRSGNRREALQQWLDDADALLDEIDKGSQ